MEFYERFLKLVASRYPATAQALDLKARLSPLLFCPEAIQLPRAIKEEASQIVSAFWALRELPERKKALQEIPPQVSDPGNASVLMSYDFHVDATGRLRLIEINTNASTSLLADLLYEAHQIPNEFSSDFRRDIMDCFKEEFKAALPGARKLETVAICDDNVKEQRMYAEFEMYKELFCNEGYRVHIADSKDLAFHSSNTEGTSQLQLNGEKIDLVYSRETDFYFELERTKGLKGAMQSRAACITPHPYEYRLLADKERIEELSKAGAIEALPLSAEAKHTISSALIRSSDLSDFGDHEALWKDRKKWFFKPKRSFGGKAAYRGSSMTKTVFSEIIQGKYVAQEFVPAPQVQLNHSPDGEPKYKYDLRFFVYRDRIQLASARVYKGQMTNSQTLGGGTAAISWI